MSEQEPWKIIEPPDIRKTFKRLGQPEKNQYRAAIRTLASSIDPRVHGAYKKSLGCYVYEITHSFRFSYDVDLPQHAVEILSIGDHKEVYGKDKKS